MAGLIELQRGPFVVFLGFKRDHLSNTNILIACRNMNCRGRSGMKCTKDSHTVGRCVAMGELISVEEGQ